MYASRLCWVIAMAMCAMSSMVQAQTTLPLSSGSVVDITVTRGRVEVRGWDRNELSLEGNTAHEAVRTSSGAQVRRIANRSSGDLLRVRVPRNSRIVLRGGSNDLDVRDIEGDVDVQVNSGDVTMDRVGGAIRITSIVGDIQVSGAAKGARIVTTAGDVTLAGARGDVQVNTTAGDITLTSARVRLLTLETMNGDVHFNGSIEETARSTISTHSGDVRLEFPSDARAMIEMRSFSGQITSQLPLVLQPSTARNDHDAVRRLQLGREGRPTFVINTFSGNIEIVRVGARDNN